MRLNCKRGSILDGLYITVICLVLFLVFAFAKVIWDKSTENNQLDGNVPEALNIVNRYDNVTIPMFDKFFVFAIFGSYFAVFIIAYFIRGTPAFLPIMAIILVIGVVLSVYVSNIHDKVVTESEVIAEAVADWPKIEFLMENLPIISFFFMVGLIIVMLAMGETI